MSAGPDARALRAPVSTRNRDFSGAVAKEIDVKYDGCPVVNPEVLRRMANEIATQARMESERLFLGHHDSRGGAAQENVLWGCGCDFRKSGEVVDIERINAVDAVYVHGGKKL